jgi:hypothetical protein
LRLKRKAQFKKIPIFVHPWDKEKLKYLIFFVRGICPPSIQLRQKSWTFQNPFLKEKSILPEKLSIVHLKQQNFMECTFKNWHVLYFFIFLFYF